MSRVITFTGNYGSFSVDPDSGAVITHDPDRDEIAATGGFGYLDVVRVDLVERREWYRKRGVDLPHPQPDGNVLDVGAWCADGGYIAAEDDWRAEIMMAHYPHAVPLDELPDIPEAWERRAWRQDVNPCWHVPGSGLNVWCGRADPRDRAAEAPSRFTVWDDATGSDLLQTEEWDAVLAIIAARAEIVKARKVMQGAADLLTSYLLDETERGFEEIPEVDQARTFLLELLEGRT